jgi:hypothetical protein
MMFEQVTTRSPVAVGRRSKFRSTVRAMLVLATASFPLMGAALPVIPKSMGYGIDTPAGRGGKVYRVTNLNDSGAGSLKDCVAAAGPRVCIFEVSGTIRLTDDLHIWNPNITIAGQTAPSPGITLRGAALNINASDVLVQHIRIRVGDDPEGPDFSNRDALKIESATPIKNIVVDHCSLAWALDETLTAWETWDDITLTNNIIAEPLHEKSNGKKSGYGLLLGQSGGGRAAVIGNLMAHTAGRNPLNRSYDSIIVNNVVYNAYSSSVELQSLGKTMSVSVVGNVFIEGADTGAWNKPISINTDGWPMVASSKVYLHDNASPKSVAGNEWSVANDSFPGSIKTGNPPIWLAGFTALPTKDDVALNHVLKFSGARPVDRDPVDLRIVKSVRERTGRMINCVSPDGTERCKKNAGGWPVLAQNRRALVLPSDPNAITPSGYTKLELWLQDMAAKVEGRSANTSPQPPVVTVE